MWKRLHAALLTELRRRGQLDLARAVVDSSSLRALRGGTTGPNPTDRRKAGSKHHILTDAHGIPLVAILTAANRNDITQLLPLVDAMPPLGGRPTAAAWAARAGSWNGRWRGGIAFAA